MSPVVTSDHQWFTSGYHWLPLGFFCVGIVIKFNNENTKNLSGELKNEQPMFLNDFLCKLEYNGLKKLTIFCSFYTSFDQFFQFPSFYKYLITTHSYFYFQKKTKGKK